MKARQAKNGKWIADMRVNRVGPQVVCTSKTEAEDRVAEARMRLKAQRCADGDATVEQAVKAFLENCKMNEYSAGTVAGYKSLFKLHIVPRLPKLLIEIDQAVITSIRENPPASLCARLAPMPFQQLGRLLQHACSTGALAINPMVDLPDISRRVQYNRDRTDVRLRMAAEDELKLCLARSSGRLHAMICVAIHAGLRLGEILALRWRSIDWIKRRIRVSKTWRASNALVERQGVKTRTSYRLVPMSKQLLSALEEYRNETGGRTGDYLFKGRGEKALSTTRANRQLHAFLVSIGIELRDSPSLGRPRGPFSWHAFRHACVARWIHANIDISRIMRWIGHQDYSTTLDIYAYEFRQRSLTVALH